VVTTVRGWLRQHLGFDPTESMRTVDWLAAPQQLLLEATAGRVFHDDVGELSAVRAAIAWYPTTSGAGC